MATVKAVLRPKKNKNGEEPIYIRVSHKGESNYTTIGISVKRKYWNERAGKVRENDYYDATTINKVIDDKVKEGKDSLYALKAEGKIVSSSKIKSTLKGEIATDFISFTEKVVQRKFASNIRTGKRYQSVFNKVKEFAGSTLYFEELTVSWIKDFWDWLATEKKNSYSTIHSNLRCIRAIINEAIREDFITHDLNPFIKLKLPRPKPQKTKLNNAEINALKALDKFTSDLQRISRDAFLFSFYTCGMRFSDLCLLTWDNIEGDSVKYFVSKTKEYLSVELLPEALEILEVYKRKKSVKKYGLSVKNDSGLVEAGKEDVKTGNNNKLLVKHRIFPLLKDSELDLPEKKLVSRIDSANAKVNSALKIVAKEAEITKHISFHVARHSYANMANNMNMPFSVIQSTLNHKNSKTTENYLKSLESEVVNSEVRNFYEALREEKK